MTVEEFVKASYLEMIFKNEYGGDIYDFTWEDTEAEENFINIYGSCTVKTFKSICDGVIEVCIDKDFLEV